MCIVTQPYNVAFLGMNKHNLSKCLKFLLSESLDLWLVLKHKTEFIKSISGQIWGRREEEEGELRYIGLHMYEHV